MGCLELEAACHFARPPGESSNRATSGEDIWHDIPCTMGIQWIYNACLYNGYTTGTKDRFSLRVFLGDVTVLQYWGRDSQQCGSRMF